MIKVSKSKDTPQSLLKTKSYDGEDVKQQLLADHHEKCYLCERFLCTDFQVEHHKSRKFYPELIQEWSNLFLTCSYCNGKKGEDFDNMLHPIDIDIENEIEHNIDFSTKKAEFKTSTISNRHNQTIELLKRLHNGTKKIRTTKEERFFEHVIEVINNFYQLVDKYLENPSRENVILVREELQIRKECLGFKYWIIKNNPQLYMEFADDIIWNKK